MALQAQAEHNHELWYHPLASPLIEGCGCHIITHLLIFLHSMLFTNIQLDDFQPTLAQFIEHLEIEGAEEHEWIMMADQVASFAKLVVWD